jgi:hypothetical protein
MKCEINPFSLSCKSLLILELRHSVVLRSFVLTRAISAICWRIHHSDALSNHPWLLGYIFPSQLTVVFGLHAQGTVLDTTD